MKNAQINWIKFYILSGFILISHTFFGQNTAFRYLDVNTLCKDKRVLALRNELPKGWRFRTNGSNFYIERIDDVYLPKEALKSIEMKTQPVEKYLNGKKILLFKTKAYFLMSVEKKIPTRLNNKQKSIMKAVYESDFYTFFLWQKHGYTYAKTILPQNLYEEFREVEKLLANYWLSE